MTSSEPPAMKAAETGTAAHDPLDLAKFGQIVLVLQGGGALGAYQVGVYEALSEAKIEPDWVIGTSIGAINGALIAGNDVSQRAKRLDEFWRRVEHGGAFGGLSGGTALGAAFANLKTLTTGVSSFFRPNPTAFFGPHAPLSPETAAYYSTEPLALTLAELIDLKTLNSGRPRLTVGAAKVATGEMHYFDSRDMRLTLKHILASGALPPAFPAVRIDGDLYWDGGILSNTPVEAVFDDRPRRDSLIFSVHIWRPHGPEPGSIWQVMTRQKDIQYSSRTLTHIQRQKQLHRLRHIINELAGRLPAAQRDERVKMLASYGCVTTMHVVRLVAPALDGEDHTKDIDFSGLGIARRREAGKADTRRALQAKPWSGTFDPLEGFILHEIEPEGGA